LNLGAAPKAGIKANVGLRQMFDPPQVVDFTKHYVALRQHFTGWFG
jgi:hypothetical protein